MEDDLNWKTTLIGRQPQNIDRGISKQPQVGSCSNFELKLIRPVQSLQINKLKKTFHGRQPKLEDNLKIFKVEYLSNH